MYQIDVHADDYGFSLQTSRDILDCCLSGKLDSISVVPNMSALFDSMKLWQEAEEKLPKEVKLSVHLNLCEGPCMAKPQEVSLLVDEKGYFNISWSSLFFASYIPGKRKLLKQQLKKEIRAQIQVLKPWLGGKAWRIDGHQHTQMIPVVLDALLEVIEEDGLRVEYIRNSHEPLGVFLKEFSLYKTYRPVNFVKNLLLSFCALKAEKEFRARGMKPMYLWGLVMSGSMDEKRVRKLLPVMKAKADRESRILEILFHPGSLLQEEVGEEFSSKDSLEFYFSKGRKAEYQALNKIF